MDGIDREILKILVANGRASHVFVGDQVGLSANGVADRIRRLVSAGVITGVHAAVDPKALGRSITALVDIRLVPESTPEDLEQAASSLYGVEEIAFVTGRFDFQLRVACRDPEELDRLLRDLRANAGVAETETRIVLRDLLRRNLAE
jgi:Lrp/AsnC family leucine-responsive transcriptional regulator